MYAKREDKRTEYEERYKKDLSSPDRDVFSTVRNALVIYQGAWMYNTVVAPNLLRIAYFTC